MKYLYVVSITIVLWVCVQLTLLYLDSKSLDKSIKVNHHKYDLMLTGLLNRNVPEIDVETLSAHLGDYQLLDSRSKEEYIVSHISKAIWVGYDDFHLERIQSLTLQTPIVVYCSVGYRSEKITQRLQKAGFQKVYNLYGGIFEWVNQGHRVVNSSEQVTKRIHAYNKIWGLWVHQGDKVYK